MASCCLGRVNGGLVPGKPNGNPRKLENLSVADETLIILFVRLIRCWHATKRNDQRLFDFDARDTLFCDIVLSGASTARILRTLREGFYMGQCPGLEGPLMLCFIECRDTSSYTSLQMSTLHVHIGSQMSAFIRINILTLLLLGFCNPFPLISYAQVFEAPPKPTVSDEDAATVAKHESRADRDSAASQDQPFKPDAEFEHFMRIRNNAKRQPVALETSVTRYVTTNDQGQRVTVDLIGVVHIGEKNYYEALNKQFENYETLLYELVAPEGTVIPKGGRSATEGAGLNPIAAMQVGMQSMLGLQFQLDHIDYTKDNFRHADMSPEEFGESMKNNDESIMKMVFKAMGRGMAQSGASGMSDFDLLLVAIADDRELKMRQLFARQIEEMEGGMSIFEGKDGSTIIDHRNAKVMEVLRSELADGKTKIAIFYGAGHLPDMQRRLTSDFRMTRAGQFWLTAWQLTRDRQQKSKKEDQKDDSK